MKGFKRFMKNAALLALGCAFGAGLGAPSAAPARETRTAAAAESGESAPLPQTHTVIIPCDTKNGFHEDWCTWPAPGAGIETGEVNCETRSYYAGMTSAGMLVQLPVSFAADFSAYPLDELYLNFDFYISDVTAIRSAGGAGEVELTSSGGPDVDELNWAVSGASIGIGNSYGNVSISGDNLVNGWNNVGLRFGLAGVKGNPNLSHLCFFRMFFSTLKPVKVAWSRIAVMTGSPRLNEEFDTVGAADNFNASGADLTVSDGALNIAVNGAGAATISSNKYPIRVPDYLPYRITADVAGDPAKITSLQLRLGSGGKFVRYDIPAETLSGSAFKEFSFGLGGYGSMDAGFNGFPLLDTVQLYITTSAQAAVRVSGLRLEFGAAVFDRKVAAIGEITFDNRAEKAPLISEAEAICNSLLAAGMSETLLFRECVHYAKLLLIREELAYYSLSETLGVYMDAVFEGQGAAAGGQAEFYASFRELNGAYSNDYTYAVEYDPLKLSAAAATTGAVTLAASGTRTVVVPFDIVEGGISYVTVKLIHRWTGVSVASRTARFAAAGLGVYAGDSHLHSVSSDGANTMPDNFFRQFYQNRAQLMYTADHWADTGNLKDITRAKEVMDAAGIPYVAAKGSEVTGMIYEGGAATGSYSLAGHALQYNSPWLYYPAGPLTNRIENNIRQWNAVMKEIYDAGGYLYIAHPYLRNYHFAVIGEYDAGGAKRVDVYTDMTGIELINGSLGFTHAQMLQTAEYWDRLNITGRKKYFGIANSDAHDKNRIGSVYSGFVMPEYSELAYNNAIGGGAVYACSGVGLRFTIDGVQMGGTVIASAPKTAALRVTARDNKQPITKVKLIQYQMNYSSDPLDSDAGYGTRQESVLYTDPTGAKGNNLVTIEQDITVGPGRFYRVEAYSTKDAEAVPGKIVDTDNLRCALSNPIWAGTPATAFTLDKETLNLKPGEWYKLEVTQTDSLYDTVRYTSSDPSKVQVEVTGRITVLPGASGTYIVTAATTGGGVVKTITVHTPSTETGGVVCPDCGKNPCVCPKNPAVCPDCGKNPCVCPPAPPPDPVNGCKAAAAQTALAVIGTALVVAFGKRKNS